MKLTTSFFRFIQSTCLVFFLFIEGLLAQQPVLLENFTLIDGTGAAPVHNKSLLIVADTIHSILDQGEEITFSDFNRVDLSGKFLLPGLFDAHTHIATNPSRGNRLDQELKRLGFMLRNGITGIRDMGGDARMLFYLKRQSALDEIVSPDIYFSALFAGKRFFSRDPRSREATRGEVSGETPWMRAIDRETDIHSVISQAKGIGADGIKLYASLSPSAISAIVNEAHRQDLKVWSHASILPGIPSQLVEAGVDALSHGTLLGIEQLLRQSSPGQRPVIDTVLTEDAPKLRTLASLMVQKKVYFDPTLTVYRNMPQTFYRNGVIATKLAYENGVKLIVGTDRGIDLNDPSALPLIEEMEALVKEAGVSTLDVIKSATSNTANLLGIGEVVGTVRVGMKANLLIVDSDPTENIMNLRKVYAVYKNGRKVN